MQSLAQTLCLGVIITLCLNSCYVPGSQVDEVEIEYRMHKLYYENSQGERGISNFYYNRKGENYMAHWQLEDSSRSSLNYHVFDSNGNIVRKSRVFSEGMTSEQTFQYGYDEDRLVYEFWDFNGQWSQTFRWEYARAAPKTFTSSNVFIRESPWYRVAEEYYDYNGQTGGPSYYMYAADNRLESKEFVRSDGLVTRTSYEYDSTGILRYSYRAFANGDTAVFHYWYGINRELLVRTWEHPDGSSGSETYRYDENGWLTEGIYQNMDGWLKGTLVFNHNEAGNPVQGDFRGNDGFDATHSFTYDLNQNLEKIHWEFNDGSTQTYTFKYISTEVN